MEEKARIQARDIVAFITSFDVFATFSLIGDTLHIRHQYITDELNELVRENKILIIEYFQTPPDIQGWCYKNDHTVEWECNQYGIWLCACYEEKNAYNVEVELAGGSVVSPVTPAKKQVVYIEPIESKEEIKQVIGSSLKDYWKIGA